MGRYAYFLGCTVPARASNYEMAARKVAAALGIEITDSTDLMCCGFPVKSVSQEAAITMAARNLAIAQEKDLELVTLCNACTSFLTEAAKILKKDKQFRDYINGKLSVIEKEYTGEVRVRHFTRVLYEDIGPQAIRDRVVSPLEALALAPHYGCHYSKPSVIYNHFEDPYSPKTLDELIKATGATSLDYPGKEECCGGAILGADENISLTMACGKLDSLKKCGADAMVLMCPFCSVMYEDNQKKIESRFERQYGIPVLYYPQLLGIALGIDGKELGLNRNKVSARGILEKLNTSQ